VTPMCRCPPARLCICAVVPPPGGAVAFVVLSVVATALVLALSIGSAVIP
jgi:hypothetical protein